ncbi:MAG: response regulator, partial [Deltaproteobacteria bacterium]|nr:response regulator [Deltaproteobacteria bacterium]
MSNILCIDDDSEFLAFIEHSLNKSYRCYGAANLKDGLNIIHRETIDLVLLDILLPKLDGFSVLEALKSDKATKDIPV